MLTLVVNKSLPHIFHTVVGDRKTLTEVVRLLRGEVRIWEKQLLEYVNDNA